MTALCWAALALALLTLAGVKLRVPSSRICFAAMGEDADMKIAPESFSSSPQEQAGAEEGAEARDYLRQKSAGNISLARQLGVRLAGLLMLEAAEHFTPWPENLSQSLRAHHRLLLFSYVVNRAVVRHSPNSILAQVTLGVFYGELEQRAGELNKYIRDMASYSLYVLCERSGADSPTEIGKIYARLCADKGNHALEEEGQRYFLEYYEVCQKLHEQTHYNEG